MARVKQGDTLAMTIALLPVVFLQMPVNFLAYITYDWDLHKSQQADTTRAITHQTGKLGFILCAVWMH